MNDFLRVLLLQDHNTRVVMAGACLFGAASGLVGTFLLMRKRSLLGDTIGHSTLPGVAMAFLIAWAAGGEGRSFVLLALGAAASGFAGIAALWAVRRFSRVKEDAALAVVLGVFFGSGIALFSAIQDLPGANAAGLERLIYGNPASLTSGDSMLVAGVCLMIAILGFVFFKEMKLVCFDEAFAAAGGWPVRIMDLALLAAVVLITVTGLQTVGALLSVALLITPPAAARFWSDRLEIVSLAAALIGGLGAGLGVLWSAMAPGLPAGALVVLATSALFAASLLGGTRCGLFFQIQNRMGAAQRLDREHVLRALFECGQDGTQAVDEKTLKSHRSWQTSSLRRALHRLIGENRIATDPANQGLRLTATGLAEARRIVRNHRLWELYLIEHAAVAPGRVDRDADLIEHALDPAIVQELEDTLDKIGNPGVVPANPEARV